MSAGMNDPALLMSLSSEDTLGHSNTCEIAVIDLDPAGRRQTFFHPVRKRLSPPA
jgi:hypothetical protein